MKNFIKSLLLISAIVLGITSCTTKPVNNTNTTGQTVVADSTAPDSASTRK